jgi:hypothetical protein
VVTSLRQKSAKLSLGRPDLNSSPQREVARGGTRIPCEIPITLTSLDPRDQFSQPCVVILANLRGCAVRSPRPVRSGTSVRLEDLPGKTPVDARVVSCISLGEFEKLWLLALALNEAGNVWGITPTPDDWKQL